jgi:hypothetical protein
MSQLTNMGTLSTRQVLVVQPLRVIKTPTDGVHAYVAHPSNNPDGSKGFHKSLVQTKTIHMELSLCLILQISRSVEGYTVGTTVGF